MPETDAFIERKLRECRVARLATANAQGVPHLIPVCFSYDGQNIYTALDRKPKGAWAHLVRVKNIQAQNSVSLLLDEYSEDWAQLWYVLIHGTARILERQDDPVRANALALLREKYAQYRSNLLPETAAVIEIVPTRKTAWSGLDRLSSQ